MILQTFVILNIKIPDIYGAYLMLVSPIKKMLSKACKTDHRIQTALRYCNKEKKGEYFCTKVFLII